ncbi:MAG: S1/P1 nuclease [Pseudomonadota bacterium]|nr:S1/P1 nuclease [Pseudomonadota bacterium]
MPQRLVLLLISLMTGNAFGWGPLGHSVVGQIAESHLSSQARRHIKEILGNQSLADAANWADEVRSRKEYSYTNTWHWATVPNGQSYESSQKSKTGDVVQALLKSEKELLVPNNSPQKAVALKFLIHFLGDIHQPFHIGREDDRGGNECRVIFMGRETNLHALWDSKMLQQLGNKYYQLALQIDNSKGEAPSVHSDYIAWASESQEMREEIYPDNKGTGPKTSYCVSGGPALSLDGKYYSENIGRLKQRLSQAGLRLAGILNSILK